MAPGAARRRPAPAPGTVVCSISMVCSIIIIIEIIMQGSLHHEVLLALSGYPGDAFRVSKDNGSIEVTTVHY